MKFIIKHEIKGRIRISLARKFHTVREADVLEQYLLGLDGVTAAKVYERTADAVIYYKEDREAVLVQVAAFDGQITEKQEMAVKSSGRALNQEYKEKLIHALNPDDDTMNFTKYEGKGIGKRNLLYIEQFAIKNGCSRICLDVYIKSKGAISFYSHLGFKEVGTKRSIRFKELIMKKQLD